MGHQLSMGWTNCQFQTRSNFFLLLLATSIPIIGNSHVGWSRTLSVRPLAVCGVMSLAAVKEALFVAVDRLVRWHGKAGIMRWTDEHEQETWDWVVMWWGRGLRKRRCRWLMRPTQQKRYRMGDLSVLQKTSKRINKLFVSLFRT